MIPTGYTEETFSRWLTQEIFFADTEGLGLADLRGAAPESYKDLFLLGTGFYGIYIPLNGQTVNNGNFVSPIIPTVNQLLVLDIKPSPFALEYGEEITLENGIVLQVQGNADWHVVLGSGLQYQDDNQVQYGDTKLPVKVISVPEGTSIYAGLRMRQKSGEAVDRIPNPVFKAILGQVLGQMGLDEISDINSENLYEFRQRAIVETLKTVMQNNVAFYPIIDNTTAEYVYAGTLSAQLVGLYQIEKANLESWLFYRQVQQNVAFNVLEESLSSETEVKVVW